MRLGLFGSSFNPVHFGHLRAAEEARTTLSLDLVLFIPAGRPPHKAGYLEEAGHRLAMLRLAVGGYPEFSVSDHELKNNRPSFSVHTLEALTEAHPDATLTFIMGVDTFLDLENWFQPDRVLALADVAIVSRPPVGFMPVLKSPFLPEAPGLDLNSLDAGRVRMIETRTREGRRVSLIRGVGMEISSSLIRSRLAARESIRFLLPEAVESYILHNKLYGLGKGGPEP